MELNVEVGLKGSREITVEEKHTAVKVGSGKVEVLATPMMIMLMENAAMSAVETSLPEGFETVGIKMDATHIAATPVGMKVKAEAELIKVENKKLTFKVWARDEKDVIGEGIHERAIINIERFMQKVQEKAN